METTLVLGVQFIVISFHYSSFVNNLDLSTSIILVMIIMTLLNIKVGMMTDVKTFVTMAVKKAKFGFKSRLLY